MYLWTNMQHDLSPEILVTHECFVLYCGNLKISLKHCTQEERYEGFPHVHEAWLFQKIELEMGLVSPFATLSNYAIFFNQKKSVDALVSYFHGHFSCGKSWL